jgi:hypothetical protein
MARPALLSQQVMWGPPLSPGGLLHPPPWKNGEPPNRILGIREGGASALLTTSSFFQALVGLSGGVPLNRIIFVLVVANKCFLLFNVNAL